MLSGIFYWSTVRHATSEVDHSLKADCQRLRTRARFEIVEGINRRIADDVHRVSLVGLFGADGAVVAGNIATLPPVLATRDVRWWSTSCARSPPDPAPNSSRAVACSTADGGRLVFAQDLDELDDLRALIERALAIVTVPALLIAVALGIWLGVRGQSRFRLLQGVIDDVAAGDLRRRLPARSPRDPFERLAHAVNKMLDRLEVALEDVRALGDDIAHELRTPLTRLRARLERGCQEASTPAAFQAVGERAIRDIDYAMSIVSAILRIRAIGEARRGSEFKGMDLRPLLEDAADLYAPIADDRRIDLVVEPGPAATVLADRDLMMEAICNLIDKRHQVHAAGRERDLFDRVFGSGPAGPPRRRYRSWHCGRPAGSGPPTLPSRLRPSGDGGTRHWAEPRGGHRSAAPLRTRDRRRPAGMRGGHRLSTALR